MWLPKIQKWVNEHGGGQIIPMSCEFEEQYFNLAEDKDAQKGKLQSLPAPVLLQMLVHSFLLFAV